MIGFALDEQGDVLMNSSRDIAMIEGADLVRQTVERVVGTQKGEWFLNRQEGISFAAVLGKRFEPEQLKNEIALALKSVDSTFLLETFTHETQGRSLRVTFAATGQAGRIAASNTY